MLPADASRWAGNAALILSRTSSDTLQREWCGEMVPVAESWRKTDPLQSQYAFQAVTHLATTNRTGSAHAAPRKRSTRSEPAAVCDSASRSTVSALAALRPQHQYVRGFVIKKTLGAPRSRIPRVSRSAGEQCQNDLIVDDPDDVGADRPSAQAGNSVSAMS